MRITSVCPVQIVGVDPIGSILAQPDELNKGGEGAMYHVSLVTPPTDSTHFQPYIILCDMLKVVVYHIGGGYRV